MDKQYTILSIDDDKFIQKIIGRTLSNDYNVIFASNGDEGVEMAVSALPDIIITDVEMPGQNGYEVCDKIRSNPVTAKIPVVFLSSLSSVREKMKGYEAGADDYLVKPFNEEELKTKISVLLRFRDEKQNLEERVNEAQKTAYIAMTGSSELGQAMQLIEQSYCASDYESLTEQFFTYSSSMDLKCSLLINQNGINQCYSSKTATSPLELDLMTLLKGQDRFHDFGCRTQINYPNISLLIKNMPLDNMERYGRIKDLFPSILAAYDAKIRSLNIEKVINEQNIALNQSFQSIKESITDLGGALRNNAQSGFIILTEMLEELDVKLPGMGLEEDQEQFIVGKVEQAVESVRNISDTGDNISSSFQMVIEQLQKLVSQQDDLLEQSTKLHQEQQDKANTSANKDTGMDIELF